ncbi:8-oxo-dGTP diphosphatase [bacterium]|nr:8-oxo-dGTP diphosphatase [bacterium]
MPYQPVLATLGYILSPDGRSALMIHRNARPDDHHYGKYNGLGGKLEPDESIVEGLARELHEEAGITIERPVLRGTISWPGFGKHGEAWFGFIFRIDAWSGTPHAANPEGSLEWVPIEQILSGTLNLWEGDRHFLKLVFDDDQRAFHGVMPYADGRPVSWSFQRA